MPPNLVSDLSNANKNEELLKIVQESSTLLSIYDIENVESFHESDVIITNLLENYLKKDNIKRYPIF